MASDRILVTVKTYPALSKKYGETVCTAGIREDGTWVRLYPVPFRRLGDSEQYKLYDWITCPLVRHSRDPRPESYRPTGEIECVDHIGTADNWRERRKLLLGRPQVFGSLDELIEAADGRSSRMRILEWQLGALYRNCLDSAGGDETTALAKVRQKYFDEFVRTDLHLFLGTTLAWHKRARNPWTIVGVLPIPHQTQQDLFVREVEDAPCAVDAAPHGSV